MRRRGAKGKGVEVGVWGGGGGGGGGGCTKGGHGGDLGRPSQLHMHSQDLVQTGSCHQF